MDWRCAGRCAAAAATPVILLTALGEEDDRIAGLQAGADECVTKPFSPRELALRVLSVLRRAPSAASAVLMEVNADGLKVLTASRSAYVDGAQGRPDQP